MSGVRRHAKQGKTCAFKGAYRAEHPTLKPGSSVSAEACQGKSAAFQLVERRSPDIFGESLETEGGRIGVLVLPLGPSAVPTKKTCRSQKRTANRASTFSYR